MDGWLVLICCQIIQLSFKASLLYQSSRDMSNGNKSLKFNQMQKETNRTDKKCYEHRTETYPRHRSVRQVLTTGNKRRSARKNLQLLKKEVSSIHTQNSTLHTFYHGGRERPRAQSGDGTQLIQVHVNRSTVSRYAMFKTAPTLAQQLRGFLALYLCMAHLEKERHFLVYSINHVEVYSSAQQNTPLHTIIYFHFIVQSLLTYIYESKSNR